MKTLTYQEEKQENERQFMEMLSKIDPELYLIKMALLETDLNPMIIPKIIRSVSNLVIGTGYGKVQIFMQARVITQIKGEESVNVQEDATIESLDRT